MELLQNLSNAWIKMHSTVASRFWEKAIGICCGELAEVAKLSDILEPLGHIPGSLVVPGRPLHIQDWERYLILLEGNLLKFILKILKENAIWVIVTCEYLWMWGLWCSRSETQVQNRDILTEPQRIFKKTFAPLSHWTLFDALFQCLLRIYTEKQVL